MKVLIIETKNHEHKQQTFIPLEEIERAPLGATPHGQRVTFALQAAAAWGVELMVADIEPKQLAELRAGKLRYDFGIGEPIRARGR